MPNLHKTRRRRETQASATAEQQHRRAPTGLPPATRWPNTRTGVCSRYEQQLDQRNTVQPCAKGDRLRIAIKPLAPRHPIRDCVSQPP